MIQSSTRENFSIYTQYTACNSPLPPRKPPTSTYSSPVPSPSSSSCSSPCSDSWSLYSPISRSPLSACSSPIIAFHDNPPQLNFALTTIRSNAQELSSPLVSPVGSMISRATDLSSAETPPFISPEPIKAAVAACKLDFTKIKDHHHSPYSVYMLPPNPTPLPKRYTSASDIACVLECALRPLGEQISLSTSYRVKRMERYHTLINHISAVAYEALLALRELNPDAKIKIEYFYKRNFLEIVFPIEVDFPEEIIQAIIDDGGKLSWPAHVHETETTFEGGDLPLSTWRIYLEHLKEAR